MSRLARTDDAVYRAQFVDHIGGIEARWSMKLRGAFMIGAGTVFGSWVIWSLGGIFLSGPLWLISSVAIGFAASTAVTIVALRALSPHDTPTTPLIYHAETFWNELRSPRLRESSLIGWAAQLRIGYGRSAEKSEADGWVGISSPDKPKN